MREASGPRVWAALGIVYVVWGSTYLAIRIMVETVPPLLGAGVRFALAGAVMLALLAAHSGVRRLRMDRRQLAAAALVGTLLAAGGNGLVTVAEQDVPSALAALLIASVPLWVALLRTAARDRVDPLALVGVLVGFAGVALLLAPGNRPDGATTGGMLLCVLAAMSWATGSFSSSRLTLPRDPLVSTGAQMLAGGLVLLVAGAAAGELGSVAPAAFSTRSLVAFAYLVVFGSLVAFTAYVWLLQHAPVAKVATYAYVNPVVAVALGFVVLGESITTITLVGAAIIVGSVAGIVRRESRPAAREPAALPARAERQAA